MGLIPDLCPSHWNLSQTIPNLPIFYITTTTPTQDMSRVAEIAIALIAVCIAIGTSDTSDSSGHESDTETEFLLLEMDNRLVLPFFIESQVSIPRLGIKADANPGVFYGQCSEICGLIPDLCPSHWNLS